MNQLIAITEENGKKTVNARELHTFLGVGRDFTNWVKDRIEKYGFVDGLDYSPILAKTSEGGRPKIEYHISLDMAKELSMVENNEKGQEARRYFIECERKLNTPVNSTDMLTASLQAMLQIRQNQVAQESRLANIEQRVASITTKTDKPKLQKGIVPCGYENKGDVIKTVAKLTGVTQEIVKLCINTYADSIAQSSYQNDVLEGDRVVSLKVICYYIVDVIAAVKRAEKECYHVTEHFAIFPTLNNKKMKYKKPCLK